MYARMRKNAICQENVSFVHKSDMNYCHFNNLFVTTATYRKEILSVTSSTAQQSNNKNNNASKEAEKKCFIF